MPTELPDSEFRERLAAVRDRLADVEADGAVWFDATSIEYLTGFHHIQTERPVALAVAADEIAITVPRLEVERVEPNPRIDVVRSYFDYPGGDPIETVVGTLADLGVESVLADSDGAPGVMGYDGPPLSDSLDVEEHDGWVPAMRAAKSDAELALIEESARWANLGHRHLADYTEIGAHPATVSQRASMEARPRCPTATPRTNGSPGATCSSRARRPTSTATTRSWSGRCSSARRATSRPTTSS